MRKTDYLMIAVLFFLAGPLLSCGGGGGPSGGGGPAISVTISPSAPTIGLSQTVVFSAEVSGGGDPGVTWSVGENGGGTINQAGTYTAPHAAGTYHVIAASQADESKRAITPVTVEVIP